MEPERRSGESRGHDGGERVGGIRVSADDPRIVLVTQHYPPDRSGHASRLEDTATHLAERGWEVVVLAPPPSFPHGSFDRSWTRVERTTADGVAVRRLWAWQPTEPDPGVVSRLAYYVTFAVHVLAWLVVARGRYGVVLTTTPPISTGLAGLPTAVDGTPWLVDVRDLWIEASVSLGFIEGDGWLERLAYRFQRRVLAAADSIAVTTPTLGETLCRTYGADLAEKLVIVPNGVDLSLFRADGRGDPGAAASGPAQVVYVGNIGYAQDLSACIRAMEHVTADAVLRLVGGGDRVPELKRLVAELDLADRVEFAGPVPRERIPAILSEAAVGLAPLVDREELSYAMPTKVYEYLGSGLPAVVTGNGELERFIAESGGGVHAENDPAAIAAAIDDLLADPARRAELGRRGQAFVRDEYARERILDRLDEHLRTLVAPEAD